MTPEECNLNNGNSEHLNICRCINNNNKHIRPDGLGCISYCPVNTKETEKINSGTPYIHCRCIDGYAPQDNGYTCIPC